MNHSIAYRDLRKYKYGLLENHQQQTAIRPVLDILEPRHRPYIKLERDGLLTISEGYAWDGPSGPTIDTKSFMRGSLVHDALYQLMRTQRIGQEWREYADDLIVAICEEDGMWSWRREWVRVGLRLGGAGSARPQPEKSYRVYTAP